MTKSMTAFARGDLSSSQGELSCELRTVNHRYLEVSVRLPDELRFLEQIVRQQVSAHVKRGRVDCSIRFKRRIEVQGNLRINEPLVDQLLVLTESIRTRSDELSSLGVADLINWPGVVETPDLDRDALSEDTGNLLAKAMQELLQSREKEGSKLAELLLQRLQSMESIVEQVKVLLPELASRFREKLEGRLAELKEQMEPSRLEQEMVIFQQKSDVSEEVDRLGVHVGEVKSVVNSRAESKGRRLDFLMQELNREANTLASKSVDIRLTNHAVDLKVLIEQMREQVQNIE